MGTDRHRQTQTESVVHRALCTLQTFGLANALLFKLVLDAPKVLMIWIPKVRRPPVSRVPHLGVSVCACGAGAQARMCHAHKRSAWTHLLARYSCVYMYMYMYLHMYLHMYMYMYMYMYMCICKCICILMDPRACTLLLWRMPFHTVFLRA